MRNNYKVGNFNFIKKLRNCYDLIVIGVDFHSQHVSNLQYIIFVLLINVVRTTFRWAFTLIVSLTLMKSSDFLSDNG